MLSRSKLLLGLAILISVLTLSLSAEELVVTGRPVTPEFMRSIPALKEWGTKPSKALRPGQTWSDPKGNRIVNLDWTPPPSNVVALSDHPEKVERVGGLFFGGLTLLRPLTFQYYHLGKLQGPSPNLTFYLHNPNSEPAQIHLRQGIGKPSLDYFSSGQTNNVEWFRSQEQNLGRFVSIQAGETVELFQQDLRPEYVVSGTLGLTQTKGRPLQFAFVARKSLLETVSLNNLLKDDDVHSRGFYPVAVQKVRRTYRVGGEPIKVAVGAVRQQTFSGVRELRGDYGVTYSLDLELKNDTAQAATVKLLFNPRGGPATATFLLDGEMVKIGVTKAFEERHIAEIALRAGESKKIKLETIPEGASNYPVRIVIQESENFSKTGH